MQLKGLVKIFTIALIAISLYQLSITYQVRNAEKGWREKARNTAKTQNPSATPEDLDRLTEKYFDVMADSNQGKVVANYLVTKYTYAQAKNEELALGLDLQGGMNVTLEVSLNELVRSMSNNPRDKALNRAINDANIAKANSDANFITLFGQKFEQQNPGVKLAYLFTKPNDKEITLNSTNEEVLAKLNKEGRAAINRTHHVLMTRIDKFGVANPNVNLDENKGIITVELAGVRSPERVRNFLQATAKLQFFETYSNQEIGPIIGAANKPLYNYLAGIKEEDTTAKTNDTTAAAAATTDTTKKAADTGSLNSLMAGENKAAGKDSATTLNSNIGENPLTDLIMQNGTQADGFLNSPVVGYVARKDTAKVNRYLALDVVKNKFPNNIKFLYGADGKKSTDPNAPIALYAVKVPPGGDAKLEGDHVTDSRADYSPMTGQPTVTMEMDIRGAQIWKDMTGRNVGKFVAVVLDDKIYSCPRVDNEIASGNTEISGSFTIEEAQDLANILKSGKLPAPAHIVQEQVVGPTLGAESISAGISAIALSFVAIFILMLIYYSTSGWVANISLTLNLLFTVGVLSAMHATLTLPGIAGLVLGIGMAVDAHVLIFERIKEELALGKSHAEAIADGYRRSNAPVLDGHIAQLITAGILAYFGLGPVLGFATTQLLSIFISLFCGILVSRLVKEIYLGMGKEFKYFTPVSRAVFNKAKFDFMGKRKIAYIVSLVVVLGGVAAVFNGFDYGVEFAGGRSYTVKMDKKNVEVSEVRTKLEKYFEDFPIVKTIGTNGNVNITTAYMIKTPGPDVERKVQEKLYEGLKAGGFIKQDLSFENFLSETIQSSQTVLPTISDDLIKGAQIATLVSLLAISIYILVRFRRWQYSLGTFVSLLFNICATLAVFSFLKGKVPFALEIDQHFIAAVLTVVGFSMNDTIIVFDRIREYFRKSPNEDKVSVINRAINDTLPRTIMTSLTVFLVVLILFIVGGEVTRGFAFAMLIGVITGTYSSIFVASPVLVDTDKRDTLSQEVDREARIEELKNMA